jgi:uncharacterized protein YcgL (UPF0745 family)
MKRLCTIYRSPRVDGMYLYVDLKEDLKRVPEALLEHFGKPQLVMKMALQPTRKLARADITRVLQSIDEKGFYLQMPPEKEDYLLDLHRERASDHVSGEKG